MSARFLSRVRAMIALGAMVLTVAGCGGKSDLSLVPVEGSVTYQGKPLSHGSVVFKPGETTPGPQAVGQIQPDGSFGMKTAGQDGVAAGCEFVVTVHCRQEPTPEQAHDMTFIPQSLIPEKYSKEDQTPLRFEAKESSHEYPIKLE